MAQARAKCTCKECGTEFIRTKTCRNRAEADSWEEWAKDSFDLCGDCYKKAREEYDLAQPLILNIRVEPFQKVNPVVLAFTGCSKKYKDKIKELGYFWREDTSGAFGVLSMTADFCWQKNIDINDLDEEIEKAKSLCSDDEFVVKNGITAWDLAALKMMAEKRETEKELLEKELGEVKKPQRPECLPGGKWNGKVYGSQKYGYSVYVDDVKITITAEEKDQIEKYSEAMDEYYAKVKEIKDKHRI